LWSMAMAQQGPIGQVGVTIGPIREALPKEPLAESQPSRNHMWLAFPNSPLAAMTSTIVGTLFVLSTAMGGAVYGTATWSPAGHR